MTPSIPGEPIIDPIFGELKYEPSMKEWHATVALTPGHVVELTIWWDERDGPFDPVRQLASQAFKLFQSREGKHREQLAVEMREAYMRSAGPDERLLPTAELAYGLSVESISIAADGSMMIDYDDAQALFADEWIVAEITANGDFDGLTLLRINRPFRNDHE